MCGKGATAAVVTALVRYTVRAEALHLSSPGALLTGLHGALLSHYPETYCTALFLLLDRSAECHRLTIATGGIRCRCAAGRRQHRDARAPGRFLGMAETFERQRVHGRPAGRRHVVLYTDGVTEAHEGSFLRRRGDGRGARCLR